MKMTDIIIKRPPRERLEYLRGGEKIRFARHVAQEYERKRDNILKEWSKNYPTENVSCETKEAN